MEVGPDPPPGSKVASAARAAAKIGEGVEQTDGCCRRVTVPVVPPSEAEDLRQQRAESLRLRVEDNQRHVDVLGLHLLVTVPQRVGEARDRRQRRPHLVGGSRDERGTVKAFTRLILDVGDNREPPLRTRLGVIGRVSRAVHVAVGLIQRFP